MSKATVLFYLGDIPVHLFGVMVALGIVAGLTVTVREAKRLGMDTDRIFDLALSLMVGGVVGARVLYVVLNIRSYLDSPLSVFSIHKGGLAFHGGVLAGVIIVIRFAHKNRVSFLKMADLLAPGLVLGYAVGRLGCDIYGNVTTVPWAVNIYGELRHPVQFYSAFFGFLIYAVLVWRRRFSYKDGEILLQFAALYSGYRFVIEFFRSEGGITPAQLFSLLILGACMLAYKYHKQLKPATK